MKKFIFTGIITILFFGCGPSSEERAYKELALQDSIPSSFISSSAAENRKDTTHKFIRTADLKFKVKSVIHSTYIIEDITKRLDGFVTYTNLVSHIDAVNKIPISADSSLETTFYAVSNLIIIRVPTSLLDTTLKEISKQIDFLDYRIIKADDVALQLVSNNLTQKRTAKNEDRLTNAIDNKGKKLKETTAAEELLLSKQEQSDNAKISNLYLQDQLAFSTIHLNIYQRQTIKRELIANDKNIAAYEPGLGSKIKEAFKYGWEILASFIIMIVRLWGFIVFALVIYWLYKKYKKE